MKTKSSVTRPAVDVLTPKKTYKWSGDITSHIVKAALLDPDPAKLEAFAAQLFNKFPLSSLKLITARDLSGAPERAAEAVMRAAKATDAVKRTHAVDSYAATMRVSREDAERAVGEFGRA